LRIREVAHSVVSQFLFFFCLSSLPDFLCSSSPWLALSSYHFFRRILPRPTFSEVCTETLPANQDSEEIPSVSETVSNVLESAERELNMGISNACAVGERAVQISWVVRTRGFSARITALPVLHTRDPELVRLRAVTLRRIWPLALSCALHCLSPRLDIR